MNTQHNFNLSIKTIGLVTIGILMIPLIAKQFSNEVNWGIFDYIIMGTLVFGTGLAFKWITQKTNNFVYKIAVGLSLITTFLLIWVNLAVGLIGAGANLSNLMYIGVVAVVITGSILSRLRNLGMERTMHGAAFAVVLVAAVTLLIGMQNEPNSSVTEILGVNGFFAALFIISALLFRSAQRGQE